MVQGGYQVSVPRKAHEARDALQGQLGTHAPRCTLLPAESHKNLAWKGLPCCLAARTFTMMSSNYTSLATNRTGILSSCAGVSSLPCPRRPVHTRFVTH